MAGTVLIVDDSPTLRRVTAMMLERGGYRVLVAGSLGQATEVLRESGPLEGALIDIVLPDGDGVELGRQLRADAGRAGLGLVMMSASAGRLRRAADVIDAVATLAKPFDGASLRARMGESIQQARRPASARPVPRPASSRGAPVSRPPSSAGAPVSRSPSSPALPGSRPPSSGGRPAPASERATLVPPETVPSKADPSPPPIVLWEEPGAELSPVPPPAVPATIAPPRSPSVAPIALQGATPTLSSDANQAALVTGALDPEALVRTTLAVLARLGADGWFHEQQVRDAVMATLDPSVEPPAVSRWPGTGPASVPPPASKSTPPPASGRPPSGPREVLRGQADAVPLGEMLQVLQMQVQSGEVRVTRAEGEEVRIYLRQGLVDLVTARGASGEFLMGRYLLEERLVDRDALDEALEASRAVGRRLGDELIARNLLSREQLEGALTRQSSELIYEVLRWTGARYVFVRDAGSRSDIELGLPVASLVMEGFQRVDEWRLIEEQIKPDMVLMRDEVALDRLGAKRIGAREQMLLDAVDGQRTVREILEATSASSFEGSKILYQFVQSRLVRRRAA